MIAEHMVTKQVGCDTTHGLGSLHKLVEKIHGFREAEKSI